MKKRFALPCSAHLAGAFFVFLALSLPLGGLEIGTKEFSADISEKGGALKALTLRGKMLSSMYTDPRYRIMGIAKYYCPLNKHSPSPTP